MRKEQITGLAAIFVATAIVFGAGQFEQAMDDFVATPEGQRMVQQNTRPTPQPNVPVAPAHRP
jgi:hypothetical protein